MNHLLLAGVLLLSTACATQNQVAKKSTGYNAVLAGYEYPHPVHSYAFQSQGQNLVMSYMDIAPANPAKETIVLLHGKNFPGAYFEQLIKSLNQKGYRVIVPDQIGFGKSSKPQSYQFSFQTLSTNTQNLLTHLGVSQYRLLGHSMGGMLASRMSLMFPENITHLYLVNPIGLEDWKTMTSYRTVDQVYSNELKSDVQNIKQYQLDSYYDGKWKAEYDKWLEIPTGWRQGPDYPLLAWNSALTADMIFTQPVIYEFKNIKARTVLVIGDRDRTAIGKAWAPESVRPKMGNYPVLGKQAAKLIPGAKLEELKGLGHMPFIEDYATFWQALSKHL